MTFTTNTSMTPTPKDSGIDGFILFCQTAADPDKNGQQLELQGSYSQRGPKGAPVLSP